jgi:hypothetical protein
VKDRYLSRIELWTWCRWTSPTSEQQSAATVRPGAIPVSGLKEASGEINVVKPTIGFALAPLVDGVTIQCNSWNAAGERPERSSQEEWR